MKKLMILLGAVSMMTGSVSALDDFEFEIDMGARVGIVNPDNLDSTFGIQLFCPIATRDNMELEGSLLYWKAEQEIGNIFLTSTATTTDLAVGVTAKYFLGDSEILPYALGGVALHFLSVEALGAEAKRNEIGLQLGGGAQYEIDDSLVATAEIVLHTGDAGQFNIMVGLAKVF